MKGRTWCIVFEDEAKKDGDVQVKYKVIGADGKPMEIRGVWEGYKKGDTPEKKAERFFNALNSPPYNTLVNVTRAGNTVCFQLRNNAPYQDITGVEVGDQTGQNFHVYDDPAEDQADNDTELLETVRFRLEGRALTPGSEVRLGLGYVNKLVCVPTHNSGKPLTNDAIYDALVTAFNALYEGLGYVACVEDGEVIIPKVPCKLGIRGGSDDEGLNYFLAMADPEAGSFARIFDKSRILLDVNRLINARLDLAGIAKVRFANADLSEFVAIAGNDGVAAGRFKWAFTVVNNTAQAADDLHVILTGSGGTLKNPAIIFQPPGCRPAQIMAQGQRIDVVWSAPCVQPGDPVAILVETDFVPLGVNKVTWTRGGREIESQFAANDGSAGYGCIESAADYSTPVADTEKPEGCCTVVSVDGQRPPPKGWKCRCFKLRGAQLFSFTGPAFGGLWALGQEGAGLNTFVVVNPGNGEIFTVQANCAV